MGQEGLKGRVEGSGFQGFLIRVGVWGVGCGFGLEEFGIRGSGLGAVRGAKGPVETRPGGRQTRANWRHSGGPHASKY